jgi:methyl-accepting chemotaxis protein
LSTSVVLKAQLETNKLSFVVLLDPKGKVVAQHNSGPVGDGSQFTDNALFKGVNNRTQGGNPEAQSGVATEEPAVLDATGLKARAEVKNSDGKGLFIEAAAPVLSGDTLQGVVLVGQLVNNDNAVDVQKADKQQSIVNEIKETVYRDLREEAGVIIADGSGTILSTNIPTAQGVATGEKVPAAGGSYEKPTFDDVRFDGNVPYYTSLVPIQSVDQQGGAKTVGNIGVAIKQEWFTGIVRRVQLTILVVTLLALALAVAGAVVAAQRLTRPIVELTEAANRISLGELDVPIGVTTDDEIGTLSESLDRMRISLKQAIERLRKR